MGQPTKLTPALQELFCEELRKGRPVQTACDLTGIDFKTYANWMKWGSGERPTGRMPNTWPKDTARYCSFFHAVKKARGEWQGSMIDTITTAGRQDGGNNWVAAMTALERTEPALWGKKTAPSTVVNIDAKRLMVGGLERLPGIDTEEIPDGEYEVLPDAEPGQLEPGDFDPDVV